MDTETLATWIEIDRRAHAHNLALFRRLVGDGVELSAVVKANAYGHGWRPIAASAVAAGADSFCVHGLDEALDLRAAGFAQDVLVMGHVPLERLDEAVAHGLRLALFNRATLERLAAAAAARGVRARVHLKLETGTQRHGLDAAALPWFLERLHATPGVALEGVYTHFANIEDTTDRRFARRQLARFRVLVAQVRAAGFAVPVRHTACSAAALVFPETRFEMVRLGLGQYGLWPSKETLLSYRLQRGEDRELDDADGVLRPVLSWKTRVAQLKTVPAGDFIGYGCSYQTTREARIAILPVGYADGYDRRLSNQGWVLIRGRRAPVRGRVCMNLIMVDVTDIPEVALEDEAVLLGRQGEQTITADQLADLMGTIHYEVVTRIAPSLPRLEVGAAPAGV